MDVFRLSKSASCKRHFQGASLLQIPMSLRARAHLASPLMTPRDTVVRNSTANSFWELDGEEEPTPTGATILVKGTSDFRNGRVLNEHWDDIFTGIEVAKEESMIVASTQEETVVPCQGAQDKKVTVERKVVLPQTGADRLPIRHIQLYTPPGRETICLEPLSCPPNAVNLIQSNPLNPAPILKPGARMLFECRFVLSVRQCE